MTLTQHPQLGSGRIALADPETVRAAHLLRRAGFTPTRAEIDRAVERGYEATVEELLHPEDRPDLEIEDLIRRYHVDQNSLMLLESSQSYWLYRIINSQRPLEEKMALFWHGLFATAYGKLNHAKAVVNQTHTFRRHGLGKFADILLELSRDPAMIFWLDNKDNHKDAPNENYGRELLELFSMGIGNYTEDDVKAAARAFTGWTIDNTRYMSIRASRDSFWPYGRIDWQFRYREDDHDGSEKTFLGHTGPFGGGAGCHRHHRAATGHRPLHRRQTVRFLRVRSARRRGHRHPRRRVHAHRRGHSRRDAPPVPFRFLSRMRRRGWPGSRAPPSWWAAPPGWPAATAPRSGPSPTWPWT